MEDPSNGRWKLGRRSILKCNSEIKLVGMENCNGMYSMLCLGQKWSSGSGRMIVMVTPNTRRFRKACGMVSTT